MQLQIKKRHNAPLPRPQVAIPASFRRNPSFFSSSLPRRRESTAAVGGYIDSRLRGNDGRGGGGFGVIAVGASMVYRLCGNSNFLTCFAF